MLSSVDCITTTSESKFLVHTPTGWGGYSSARRTSIVSPSDTVAALLGRIDRRTSYTSADHFIIGEPVLPGLPVNHLFTEAGLYVLNWLVSRRKQSCSRRHRGSFRSFRYFS